MSNEKILVAGPWIGEFGWELFSFQPSVRAMAKKYDKVFVASRKGNDALYSDFCTKFISFDLSIVNSENGTSYLGEKIECFGDIKYDDIFIPYDHNNSTVWCDNITPKFIKFGEKKQDSTYDLVIHARNIPAKANAQKILKKKVQRNWGQASWNEFVNHFSNQGLTICSIGTLDAAFHIEGTEDKRGIPLKDVTDIMRSSKLIVGPSSGPMHLATLCDCPQYVWTHKKNIVQRYKTDWNPFGTRSDVLRVGAKMNPAPQTIIEGVSETLNTL
jgi:hypothetical protein